MANTRPIVAKINAELVGQKMFDFFTAEIISGRLKAGTLLEGTTVLAKRFGVSLVTAHLVLRRLSAEGYILRRPGRRTLVSAVPGSGKSVAATANTIGIIMPYMRGKFNLFASPGHFQTMEGIMDEALQHGWNVNILNTAGTQFDLTKFRELRLLGVIYCYPSLEDDSILAQLRETGLPMVLLNPIVPAQQQCFSGVGWDYGEAGACAVDYFAAKNCRKLAFIASRPITPDSHRAPLLKGFAEKAAAGNLDIQVIELTEPRSELENLDAHRDEVLARLVKCDGAFCDHYLVAERLAEWRRDMKTVGMFAPRNAYYSCPVFRIDEVKMGRTGAEVLSRLITTPGASQEHIQLKPDFLSF